MSRWMLAAPFALALGCLAVGCDGGKKHAPDAVEAPAEAAPADAAPAEPAAAPPAERATPAALYAECKDRVEMPETAGECKTDADCAPVGCGKEVCTSAKAGAEVMSTCEDRPCFKVLDACGCHEGACTWTLKADAPAGGPAPLPASLPPTGKPGDAPPGDGKPADGKPGDAPPAGDPKAPAPADAPKP